MATATTTRVLSMKLVIDTKAERVLFAEADKDVVDFLFSLLAVPVSTAVNVVGNDSIVGSIGNLYASVEELDDTYILQGVAKRAVLSPMAASAAVSINSSLLCLPVLSSSGLARRFYRCSNTNGSTCRAYVTDVYAKACPCCASPMTTAAQYLSGGDLAGNARKGFVQGIVTYTVMDNLKVTPMSATSSITLLNTLAVRDLGDLQEKTVQVGYNEGLEILKASLQSKTVLTDVFLGNKKACVADISNIG